ncbi:MAG: DUF190 domain-containing protein [Bacteroidales bacterium]
MSKEVLKIHASNTGKTGNELLYERIVYMAREKGIAGVTVYRGIVSYGLSSRAVTSAKFWELTEKLPVMIEIIDETEKLKEFFRLIEPNLIKMPKGCLITIEPVTVLLQKAWRKEECLENEFFN